MSFPAYESYKESGVEFWGAVPSHWDVCALGYRYDVALGKMLDEKRISGEHLGPYLRNTDVQWGSINVDDLPQMDFSEVEIERYSLKAGDLLVCEGGEVGRAAIWKGQLARCFYQKALHRLRPHATGDASQFFYYVLEAAVSLGVFAAGGGKATIAHLPAESFRRHRFPFPSASEQRAIATFLDRETAKIDALVEAQERLIALLKEKRQAVISHAVTKGLDPSAPMKDSGVEWLGQVPAHWEVCSAKRVASVFVPQRNKPELNSDGVGIGWVTMDDMRQHDIWETHRWVSTEAAAVAGSSVLPAGSVIASCVGNFGVSSINRTQVIINQQLQAYIPSPSVFAEWLAYSVRLGVRYFEQVATVATLPYVNQIGFGGLPLALPPMEEQRAILRNLEERIRSMGSLIEGAEVAVSLLKERRAALISAAVTGKIDVRGLVQTAEAA